MSRSGVCALRGDANIYIVTRYTSPVPRACPSIVRAIGPINRSSDVLVRTCHEKNKSETCFAFFSDSRNGRVEQSMIAGIYRIAAGSKTQMS
ncbi:unnamed protein product [Macrosiphum euphorbiae]|uniref:Uncharacterized protein n=1 Tax=Macrosiphum euphorbiae TaxID=13131 RepID=A0AAV0W2D0_9HEMI|nr:unnamed protein product [Macrosiphum euphorbiae]